jgi:hypothetical protein
MSQVLLTKPSTTTISWVYTKLLYLSSIFIVFYLNNADLISVYKCTGLYDQKVGLFFT